MSEKKNDELAKSVVGFLDKYGEKLWNSVKTTYGKVKQQTALDWRLGYETYLNKVFEKYSYAKPFLSGNFPRHLDDFYIPLSVSCGEDIIEETSIEDLTLTNKFSIIVANAGSGKTMLMRHLVVDTIKNKKVSHLPVFVELRELNNKDLSLFDLIKKKLRDNGFNFDDNYIEKAFEAGHFALFFDGFDEVAYDKREKTNEQIQELADKYGNNYFVLSSRPDDSLYRWILFDVWQVDPLNVEQACKLVEKTNEDEELKEKFIKALQEELFVIHESFLSNPLLLSIMLITYKDSANIPQKLTTFYERAYIALFERHDATKGAFSREKRSKLDIIDFKRVFSAFCFLTYRKERYGDFTEIELYEFLDKAIKTSGINIDKKCYIDDAIQAVCLLVRDGLNITFSHRSFQEYFAALFVSQLDNENQRNKILKSQLKLSFEEKCVGEEPFWEVLYEISPAIVEKFVVLELEVFFEHINIKNKLNNKEFKKILQKHFMRISIYEHIKSDYDFDEHMEDYYIDDYFAEIVWSWNLTSNVGLLNLIALHISKTHIFISPTFHRGSKFLDVYDKKIGISNSVSIYDFVNDDELFKVFAKESVLEKMYYEFLINLKNQLIEKYQQQESLLDEDF